MNDAAYTVRRKLINELNIPLSTAQARWMTGRQALKVFAWEGAIRATLAIKRSLDIAVSAAALFTFMPFFLCVAAAIALEDGGPVLFVQKRVGLNGREFRFYKFRSMYRDAEKRKALLAADNESGDGVTFKMKKDPRVTRVGRIIRRFSIDEMPQFLNVLRGDLSLVGPRPPVPAEVALYTLEQRKRLHVMPGLTCIWQISGRSDIPFIQQVTLDLQYIHSRGLLRDCIIILKTIPAVFFGRGAY